MRLHNVDSTLRVRPAQSWTSNKRLALADELLVFLGNPTHNLSHSSRHLHPPSTLHFYHVMLPACSGWCSRVAQYSPVDRLGGTITSSNKYGRSDP